MIFETLLILLAQPAQTPAPPTSSTFEKIRTPEERPPVGSRVSRRTDQVTAGEEYAAWIMHRFAECLVRTREGQMLEFLSTPLNSPAQNRIVRDVIGWRTRCLQARTMRIDHILLRGAVAEALFRQEQRGRQIGRVERAPAMLDADPARNSAAALERFGRCMVARHPDRVRALIGTRPGSRQERQAMAGINPLVAECLPRSPRRARHPLLMRGALAEAFYFHVHGLLTPQSRVAEPEPTEIDQPAQEAADAPAGNE